MQGNFPDKLEAITELGSRYETSTVNSRSRMGTFATKNSMAIDKRYTASQVQGDSSIDQNTPGLGSQ